MKSLYIILFCFYCLLLSSCFKSNETETIFIGDSLIARWDLDLFFPNELVYNYGLSGSGIEHIEDYQGRFEGKEIVVIIGTNDIRDRSIDNDSAYVERYVSAILALKGERVFLFSIFPRDFKGDWDSINSKIQKINQLISEKIKDKEIVYIDVFSDMLKDETLNMEYSYDGLHLNPNGYELITYRLNEVRK